MGKMWKFECIINNNMVWHLIYRDNERNCYRLVGEIKIENEQYVQGIRSKQGADLYII